MNEEEEEDRERQTVCHLDVRRKEMERNLAIAGLRDLMEQAEPDGSQQVIMLCISRLRRGDEPKRRLIEEVFALALEEMNPPPPPSAHRRKRKRNRSKGANASLR